MNNITLKARLRAGQTTVGSWITLGHTAIAEILANAGYDWVVVDLEHSTISIDTAGDMIRVIDLCGSVPLVRVTSNDANQIKRVMDAGAHGIVVPMVNSAEEARRAVAAVHYAPRGNRGVGLGRAQGYGAAFKDYLAWQEEHPVVIVQIEHHLAVDRLEEILAVPGVDGLIVGPYDLSCSMGIPGKFEMPEFVAIMDKILQTAIRVGSAPGLHIVEPDTARLKECLNSGYRLIAYGVDIRMLDLGAREGLKQFKEVYK